jgi:Zn-dependent protease
LLPLPSLRFNLFGFPVSIGLDFLLISFFLGAALGSLDLALAWVVVVAVSILVHELGHAFALRRYHIHSQIMLWGLGGLTVYGFELPPRKAIVVSLAGPFFGVPIGLMAMVALPLFDSKSDLAQVVFYVQWVNLLWGLVNLLPIAGLDGGNVITNGFAAVLGPRGKAPGQVAVAVGSVLVAVGAVAIRFPFLAVLIVIFGFINPTPYREAWRIVTGRFSRSRGPIGASGQVSAPRSPVPSGDRSSEGHASGRSVAAGAAGTRRAFGEVYAETLGERAGAVDLDDLERRPAPLMPDVAAMVARGDDAGIAARLVSETDPLAVIAIVARVVEGRRVTGVIRTLRQEDERTAEALLKLQVGLYALGRFEESIGAANALGSRGNAGSALLVARCAARIGDRKLVGQALERAVALGPASLSDAALGDIARVGPDERLSSTLARLRSAAPPR